MLCLRQNYIYKRTAIYTQPLDYFKLHTYLKFCLNKINKESRNENTTL